MKLLFSGITSGKISYFGEHSHNCWEIVVVTDGCGMVSARKENFEFHKGSAYIIPPNIKHTVYSDKYFSDAYIHVDQLNFNTERITGFPEIQDLPTLIKIIYKLYIKRHEGYSLSLENMLHTIISLLYDSAGQLQFRDLSVGIRDYLAENIDNPDINMKIISKKFGYNTDYIRRCFKDDFGTTPTEYLAELRINHARKLLTEMPFYSVEEISRLCGYSDPFYFSRVFKKSVGLSPQKFKNSIKITI